MALFFKAQIDCSNAAFDEDASAELARILREWSDKIAGGVVEGAAMDINGNRCGVFRIDGRISSKAERAARSRL